MDRQRLIVLLASLQQHKTQSVQYHWLVLAYIRVCPSTMWRRGTHRDFTLQLACSIIWLPRNATDISQIISAIPRVKKKFWKVKWLPHGTTNSNKWKRCTTDFKLQSRPEVYMHQKKKHAIFFPSLSKLAQLQLTTFFLFSKCHTNKRKKLSEIYLLMSSVVYIQNDYCVFK